MHVDPYQHSPQCWQFREANDGCICIAPRFRKVFFVAISFAVLEWAAGWLVGSGAVRGDAWHLASDSITDLSAWMLAAASARSAFPHLWHRYGTMVQAGLLALASVFILVETFVVGHSAHLEGAPLIAIGAAAAAINYWRFRIAHPGGEIAPLLRQIAGVLRARSRVQPFFIGEVLHILSDLSASALVVLGGFLLMGGADANIDEWIGGIMAGLVLSSAGVTALLARKEHHH